MTSSTSTCKLVYKSLDGAITFDLANLVFIQGEVEVIAFSTNTIDRDAIKNLDSLSKDMLSDVYLYVSNIIAKCINSDGSNSELFASLHSFSCLRLENWRVHNNQDFDFADIGRFCGLTLGGQFSLVFPNITQEIIEAIEQI